MLVLVAVQLDMVSEQDRVSYFEPGALVLVTLGELNQVIFALDPEIVHESTWATAS